MLFGPVDTSIVKYQEIENAYRDDIDVWMSNMYFVVSRKDTLANPYTVQLVLDEETKKRYDKHPETGEDDTATTSNPKNSRMALIPLKDLDKTGKLGDNPNELFDNIDKLGDKTMSPEDILADKKRDLIDEILRSDSSEDDEDNQNVDPNLLGTSKSPHHDDTKTKVSSTATMKAKKPVPFMEYTYHIPRSIDRNPKVSDKIQYVVDEAISDLGFSNILSFDFWISMIILFLAVWIRGYLHNFGYWILLQMVGIPVTIFSPTLYAFVSTKPISC